MPTLNVIMRLSSPGLPLSTTVLSLALVGCTDYGISNIPAPDAPGVTIEPQEPRTLDRLQALIEEDDRSLRHQFTWYRDGERIEQLQSDTVPSSLTAKGEVWQVRVVAFSGNLQGGEERAETEILNTPPSVTAEWLDPNPTLDDDLVVSAVGFDPDDDPISLRYVWAIDGVEVSFDGETLPASETGSGQTFTVRIYGHDGEEEGEPAELSLTISNTAPVIGSVTLEPDPAFTDTDLTATAHDVFDADDDPVTLTYDFYVEGSQIQSGSGATLSSSSFVKGNEVYVSITPFDGFTHGTPVASPTLIIRNTPPELATATVTPSPLLSTDDATCTGAGVFDLDGDSVSLTTTWFVDGVEVHTGDVLSSDAFARGNSIACSITPFDGEDEGDAVLSSSVLVENSPPVITSGSLSPSDPTVSSTVSSSVSGSDADGDPISYTYQWSVNGSLTPVDTTSFEVRPYAAKGDTISLEVTASDGFDSSDPTPIGSVTVVNTLPTAPEIEITPRSPIEGSDDLLCDVIAESSDADGDPLSYHFSWTVNGSPFTGTTTTIYEGDTVPASVTVVGQEWECTVHANDGEGDSPSVTDSVVIIDWAGERRFTSCGQSGPEGPIMAQCSSAYLGTTLEGEITMTDGAQRWVVPSDGIYSFNVVGGHGAASSGAHNERGGRGAIVRARRSLLAGDVIYIRVGQGGSYSPYNGGGGGATFVNINSLRDTDNLLVAGGGGGTRASASSNGGDGSLHPWGLSSGPDFYMGSASATYNNTVPHGFQYSGDPPRNGTRSDAWTDVGFGGLGAEWCYGDGGAGWFDNGHRDEERHVQARSLISSGIGGVAPDGSHGGFGGGGAGQGCWGGGGGGGYTGGNGGFIAGGGGSFANGFFDVSFEIDTARSYPRSGPPTHGYVVIDLVE